MFPRRRRSIVLESPSSTLALRNRLRLSRPGSYYFGAGGGLGFGAAPPRSACSSPSPSRPVVCVLGEGSAQYAIHGALDRGRLRGAGHVPRPAQRGVRDPQVVRASSSRSTGAPGLDLPRARRRRAWPRATASTSRRVAARDELREALGEAIARRRAAAGRGPRRARACRCRLSDACPCPRTRRIGRRAGGRRASDRAPDALAGGTPEPLRARARRRCSAPTACSRARLDLVRYASDASPYRLFPQAVVDGPRRRRRRARARLRRAAPASPVTLPRAAGTSLNGQAQGDGHPGRRAPPLRSGVEVDDGGARARVRAGHGARAREPRARRATAASSGPTRRARTSPPSAA